MNLAKLSIQRPIFVTCIVILMLVLGAFSLHKMGVDLFPDVTFPVVAVQTVYPGASPNDIETLVSKPIEEELGSLSGLERLRSTNQESVSFVIAEFKLGTDIKASEQQIRDRIGNVRRKLPDDIEEPLIKRFDPSDQPIMRLAVTSNIAPGKLFDILDKRIKPQLERVLGVGQVDIIGSRKREVRIELDLKALQDRKLSVTQVASRIGATSKNIPVGKVEDAKHETVMRTIGEFSDLKALEDVNVNFLDLPIQVSDVGHVSDTLVTETTRSTLNGKQSVFLQVYRQSGTNTIQVANGVKKAIGKINDTFKLQKIDAAVSLVYDGAKPIELNVADVYESILIGILLCVVVVFFFLGSVRSTIITGLALPNSLLGAFVIMYAMGFTINIMTLLALSLAVGLLIDDAIVVRENIFRHLEMGEEPKVAAERGTNEVALAVLAVTLVVIAVFGPIAFLDGIVGQFFKQFGLTVVFAMLISLFDAMTIAPMLSAYLASANEHVRSGGIVERMLGAFDRFQQNLERIYERALRFTVKRPWAILLGAVGIFIFSLVLVGWVPKTFLPPQDEGEFEVRIEMPPGTSLEQMSQITKQFDDKVRANENVGLTAAVSGNTDGQANQANIYVQLKPWKNRSMKTFQVKDRMRGDLSKIEAQAIVKVQDVDISGGDQRPFNLNVAGEDLDQLGNYVEKLKARMAKIPGFVDVDTNYRLGKPEFQVSFDRKKAEQLGVSMSNAGAELRARVEGVVAGTYRENGEEYDIRVRLRNEDRDLRKTFATTVLPNVNNNMISLSRMASFKESSGFSQINRENRGRYIQISGDIGPGGALDSIIQETNRIMKEELPPPVGVTSYFRGQAEDFADLMSNIAIAMILGVVFIYLVLSSLYESFITPLTILLALPLAMCGAFGALFITHTSINIFSLIGIVMLLGVVAKNSILLVDYTEQLLAQGMERKEAIVKACTTRLRPILMTSFALIAGTIPIAIGLNEASAQRTSMGIAIIGGLISSTFLTLLVVPAAFEYIDDFRIFMSRILTWIFRPKSAQPKSK